MIRKIAIKFKCFEIGAELLEKEHPKTCDAIWHALPFEAEIEVWKEEIYFEIPVKIELENPTTKTTTGDVSYWPDGPAFCLFFGKSQPIGPINTFAMITSGIENFRKLKTGDRVTVEKLG
ncbi:MAG: cyclophilin-like fold protein [Methanobacteriota archaeon]